MKYRYENFGGIISSEDPPFLAFVDREFMREQGLKDSPLWKGDADIGRLTAPTEVHLSVTNRCPVGCKHCYMDAGAADDNEMDTEQYKKALKVLADMGVFHIAMGGGEALVREDLFELAAYAREVGLVPNLTVSGFLMTPELAEKMTVFGQVNISIDAVGEDGLRWPAMFEKADAALDMLVAAGIPVGINTVVSRRNFEQIPKIFEYAERKGANEVELLRFKPAGRGGPLYENEKITYEQSIRLGPMLSELAETSSLKPKIDCSFMPMFCYHRPDRDHLVAIGAFGCEAGNVLAAGRSNGVITGCSFMQDTSMSVFDMPEKWESSPEFERMRNFAKPQAEPCKSCDYLDICKGGCHVVSEYVDGNLDAPDPDCPWVVEYRRSQNKEG